MTDVAVDACRYAGAPNHQCFPEDGLCQSEKHARALEPGAAERAARERAGIAPGAHGVGLVALIGPGWYVNGRDKDPHTFDGRINGLVVGVTNDVDQGTGETHRTFELLHWFNGRMRIRRLHEDDVDPAESYPADPPGLRSNIRALAGELYRLTRKRGAFDTDVARAAALTHLLMGVLQGNR